MLRFAPRRVFVLRGIENPYSFLTKNGFISTTASELLSGGKSYIRLAHIEKMCRLLNCTPNDLFEWKPDKDDAIADTAALNSLRREPSARTFSEVVKDIPLEKLAQIEKILRET